MKKKSIRSGSVLNKSVCPLSMWNWFVALRAIFIGLQCA